jgi:hypothetical protein
VQPPGQAFQQSQSAGSVAGEPSVGSVPANQAHSDKLKTELDEGQASLEKLTKANASLKADLDAAQKWEKDVEQAISDYNKALPALQKDRQNAEEYVRFKLPTAEAALGHNKDTIAAIIEAYDQETDACRKAVEDAETAATEAAQKYQSAARGLQTARENFVQQTSYLATQTGNLKQAKDLIANAEKEDADHPANRYFLTKEIEGFSKAADLEGVVTLKQNLAKALDQLNTAADKARQAKTDWESTQIDLTKKRKALDDREAKRRDSLLKAIADFNVKALPEKAAPAP